MPIYEYRCTSCGFQHDYLQKLSESPLTDCPECGRSTLAKQVTAAGFQLKGTGWYATDFKNSGKGSGKDSAKDAGNGSGKDSAKDAGKAVESKSEPAAEGGGAKPEASAGGGASAACT